MSSDPLKDLMDTPSENDDGGTYYEIALLAVTRTGHGPTWTLDISPDERDRVLRLMEQTGAFHSSDSAIGSLGVFDRLKLTTVDGARHEWYGVRVVALVETTSETRRRARTRSINGDLHTERIRRDQRRASGMTWENEDG